MGIGASSTGSKAEQTTWFNKGVTHNCRGYRLAQRRKSMHVGVISICDKQDSRFFIYPYIFPSCIFSAPRSHPPFPYTYEAKSQNVKPSSGTRRRPSLWGVLRSSLGFPSGRRGVHEVSLGVPVSSFRLFAAGAFLL